MYVKVNINNLLMNITLDYFQYIKNATADLLMKSFTHKKRSYNRCNNVFFSTLDYTRY